MWSLFTSERNAVRFWVWLRELATAQSRRHLHNASGERGYVGTPQTAKFKRYVMGLCVMRTWCSKLLQTTFHKLSAKPYNVRLIHGDKVTSFFDNSDEVKDEALIKQHTLSKCYFYVNKLNRGMAMRYKRSTQQQGKVVPVLTHKPSMKKYGEVEVRI